MANGDFQTDSEDGLAHPDAMRFQIIDRAHRIDDYRERLLRPVGLLAAVWPGCGCLFDLIPIVMGGLWTLAAMGAAVALRAQQRAALRHELAGIPAEQRAEILLPLRFDPCGDVRKLAEPLLRELGLPAEVAPARAPGGTGQEVLPAGAPQPQRPE